MNMFTSWWRRRALRVTITHLPAAASREPLSHVLLLGTSLSWVGRRHG